MAEPKSDSPWVSIVGVLLLIAYLSSGSKDAPAPDADVPQTAYGSLGAVDRSISRDEAIDSHWDEVSEFLNGTESVEACRTSTGRCYQLDADFSSGRLETLHFLNGGFIDFGEEVSNDGTASGLDSRGDSWDFQLDMDSSLVDDAIQEWTASR